MDFLLARSHQGHLRIEHVIPLRFDAAAGGAIDGHEYIRVVNCNLTGSYWHLLECMGKRSNETRSLYPFGQNLRIDCEASPERGNLCGGELAMRAISW